MKLSPRQYEIAMLVRDGLSNEEIADRIESTVGAIKSHLMHAYGRTGARNRVELALMAERGQLITQREAACSATNT